MDKYTLLIILNIPFVIFGIINALVGYKESSLGRFSLLIRLIFWGIIAGGLIFAKNIYNFLIGNDLTNSSELTIADVVLVTGVSFCLFLCIRLYAKAEQTERRLSELHEKISVINSKNKH